jgi:hypothetical protein
MCTLQVVESARAPVPQGLILSWGLLIIGFAKHPDERL